MAASNPMGYTTPHGMAHMTSMPHPISQAQPGMMTMMGHGPGPGQGMPMPGQGMPNYSQGMQMQGQPMPGQAMPGYNQGMPGMGGQGMPHAMAQPQQQKEVNTVELCRVGQETTQEIANKTTEVFQMLKTLQLPNNMNVRIQDFQDRKAKTEDCMKNLAISFHKLRVIYNRVEQDTAGLPEEASEDLLPMEDTDGNIKGKLPQATEAYKFVSEEHQELLEQLHQKNQQIKEIIDQIRTIIWEINTMFAMRKI